MADPYRILGVASTASDADIDAAYKYLYGAYHPDKHAGMSSHARYMRLFKQVQRAYLNLCERRAPSCKYDDMVRLERACTPTSVPPDTNQMLK